MNFDRRPGPKRSQLKRQLYQLIVARSDLTSAWKMVELLLKREPGDGYDLIGNELYPAFFYAIVVSYARPFTDNEEIGALPKRWSRFPRADLRQTHDLLIETRNTVVAHSDPIGHSIEIVPPGYQTFPTMAPSDSISLHIAKDYFGRSYFESIHRLCHYQLVEMNKAIDVLLEKLYEGMELPQRPFKLRIDEGL